MGGRLGVIQVDFVLVDDECVPGEEESEMVDHLFVDFDSEFLGLLSGEVHHLLVEGEFVVVVFGEVFRVVGDVERDRLVPGFWDILVALRISFLGLVKK